MVKAVYTQILNQQTSDFSAHIQKIEKQVLNEIGKNKT